MPAQRLCWDRDGRDWPLRAASRFVVAGGLRWHVQVMGAGPCILLVHGTGSATHNWRGVMPALSRRFRVVAPDLPGHGFTDAPAPEGFGTEGMGRLLAKLLAALDARPLLCVGHSAGAALLVRMAIDGTLETEAIASVNGALTIPRGAAWRLFGPAARMLAASGVAARMVCALADPPRVAQMAESTGSRLDSTGLACYSRLAANPAHVAGVLAMMARWDLEAVERDLPRLRPPLFLAVGEGDLAVPPGEAERVRERVGGPPVRRWPRLGHLAHEEDPGVLIDWIDDIVAQLAQPRREAVNEA